VKQIASLFENIIEKKKSAPTSEINELINEISLKFNEPFKSWQWVVRRAVAIKGVPAIYAEMKQAKTARTLMYKLKEIYDKRNKI
jgi:hypothetical protein